MRKIIEQNFFALTQSRETFNNRKNTNFFLIEQEKKKAQKSYS